MSLAASSLYELSEEQLLEKLGSTGVDSPTARAVRHELRVRETFAVIEAAKAQIEAAQVAKVTAVLTLFIAVAVAVTAIVAVFSAYHVASNRPTEQVTLPAFVEAANFAPGTAQIRLSE